MRILAIRGENLASLAERFALEFEHEPLRSAGLFGITGETGAGKSTILDALCLALYDSFPRAVAGNQKEKIPDASGEDVNSAEPANILRRGAGRGFAEADFIARDGRRYRARCELARARGKAAGRLQKRGRSLWLISESGEKLEAIESGVELVNNRVVELTDLTFDQFRRTVLLAQGDFDAFLRADAKERADLLEKITGAEIYGRLSKRAYERADGAKRALAALEQQMTQVGAMPEEARAAIVTESAEIDQRRASLSAEQKETLAALARLDKHAQAQAKHTQAEADHGAAIDALSALDAERRTLAELAQIEPLRAPLDERRRAEIALADKRNASAQAQEQMRAARVALDDAQMAQRAAADVLEAAAREVAQFEPQWTQAAALDARIEAQARETEKAAQEAAAASARVLEKRQALETESAEEAEAAAACATAREAFDAIAPAKPLFERWREIDEWLGKRATFKTEEDDASRALAEAERELKRADDMRASFDEVDTKDRDALGRVLAQAGEREAARDALDAPAAQRRLDDAARAHEALHAMARCARDHEAAEAQASRASQEQAEFAQESAALAGQVQQLRTTRAQQAAQNEEAARLGDLAEAAADPHATRLRAALDDGAPCPVCGATEHPFAHSNDAARELVVALRAKRDAARKALAQTDAEIAQITAREARARALHDDARRRLGEAQSARAGAAQEYASSFAQLADLRAPEAIDGAAAVIAEMIGALDAERLGLAKTLESARLLRDDIDLLRKAADERRKGMEERRREREDAESAARRAGEARAMLTQKLAGAAERIESLDRALTPFLALFDLARADLDRDAAAARARLEAAGKSYGRAQAALESAEARRAGFAPRIAALAAETRGAGEQATEAARALAARRIELSRLQEARAALLGGEATVTHRARIEGGQKAARAVQDTAREAAAQAGQMMAACEERSAGAARDVAASESALVAARDAFDAALAASGVDETQAHALLSLARDEVAALRAEVEAAQARLASTEAALAARRADLAEAEAAGLPEAPRDALASHEAELSLALEETAARLGSLREKLLQDDAARLRATALSGEIEAARATRRLWDEISEAIGSANGDKFRRYAQSVTLEQLVALANQRLALLSPRYALERAGEMGSLGLQIVDRDLGDERRSTRSLSGGERFLASLALALALAGLEGRDSFVDTLFIDEGFGALDSATLDIAIDALENLQGQGRKVGVISHVESMQQRIATKVCVERRGGGVSVVRLRAPGFGG